MAMDRVDGIDRRRLLGLFAGVGAAGLTGGLSACATTTGVDAPKGTVRLGLLVPATGANKAIGAELEKGFRLYLEMHGGKMSGHDIDLIVEDEGDTIQSGTAALKALHDKNVAAITGVANPDLLPSIRDAIEKSQVPLLAAHGSSADMASAVYIWRTAFVNNEPGRAIGLYLKSRGAGKVGLIGLQDNFTKDAMTGLETEHSNVTDRVWVQPTGKPDQAYFRADVQRLLTFDPSVIFCSLPTAYVVPFLQTLRANGGKQEVYAPGMVSENLPTDQLGGANGLYTAMQYSSDLNNPSNRAFSAQFQTRHPNSPTAFAVASFDAAAVLDGAIALCGDETISALRINQEIPNVGQVVSPRGNWQFNQARSPQQKWYLRQIRPDGNIWSNVLIGDLATLG